MDNILVYETKGPGSNPGVPTMKNSEVAQVFRDAVKMLEVYPDEELVDLSNTCMILLLTNKEVGTMSFQLHPRRSSSPVWSEEEFERIVKGK